MRRENGCIRVFADKEQIDRCKEYTSEGSEAVKLLASALNLAGNEVRLNILNLLYKEGKLCVCDLSDVLNMKSPAISQHLRKMKDGGVIEFEKDGQIIYYSICSEYHDLFESFFEMIATNNVLRRVS